MSIAEPLELERQRDFSDLLSTALRIYRKHPGTLIAIGAAVSIPVNTIILGFGLEELSAGYDEGSGTGKDVVLALTSFVTNPLIIAMTAMAILDLGQGRPPSAGSAVQRGLDIFAPLFLVVVMAAAAVAVGLVLLIVPGIYLAIRFWFVVQVVAIEGARGTRALARSGELVAGSWWRVFAIVVATALITAIPGVVLGLPLSLAAEAADRAVLSLVGTIVTEALTAPFNALVVTLLYYDLRARARAAKVPHPVGEPPSEAPPG